MIFALLFATGSGAYAQSEGEFSAATAAQAAAHEVAIDPAAGADSAIRFVASPVVQDIPEQAAAPGPAQSGSHATLHEAVAAMPYDGELGPELTCLAQAVYFEARGEPLAGQLAVARVIVNRTASGLFPADYCSVVTQRSQFSFVRGGRIPAANERSDAWLRAVRIARVAHQDLWPSEVGDALYFHANHVRPRWAGAKVARATIDSHIFYR